MMATETAVASELPALQGGQQLWPLSAWDRLAVLIAREWPRPLPLLAALAAWAEREGELELPLLLLRPDEAATARALLREMESLGLATLLATDERMEQVRLRLGDGEAREWLRRRWRQRLAGLVMLEGLGEGWQGITGARVEPGEWGEAELDVVVWNGRGALWVCCLLDLSLPRAEAAGRLGRALGLEKRALLCLLPPNRSEGARAQRAFGGPVLTLPELGQWAVAQWRAGA